MGKPFSFGNLGKEPSGMFSESPDAGVLSPSSLCVDTLNTYTWFVNFLWSRIFLVEQHSSKMGSELI